MPYLLFPIAPYAPSHPFLPRIALFPPFPNSTRDCLLFFGGGGQSLEDLDEATLLNAREASFYFNRANAYLLLNNAPQVPS